MDTGGVPDPLAHTGEAEAARDPLLGRNIGGKFVLEKQLGAGAMGAVYRAKQTALEKVVAIKVMHGELARDPMFAARFHREAKAASRLDHPNSIGIIDYGQDADGLLYIAMEFLNGTDLAHLIEHAWPMPVGRIVELLSQALSAIAVAHDLGITHRDLKPENIMVLRRTTDEGVDIDVVKVCDFGIAKLVEADEPVSVAAPARGKLTTAGLVIGTPAYMSPEQGRGEVIDGRSDLYSMGVILFQMLTGQLPYDAPSAIGLVVKHQTEPVPIPSTVRPGVDSQLEAVCVKALQKAPADRFQTARDLRAALRAAIDAGPGSRMSIATGPRMVVPSSTPTLPHEEAVTARTELQLAAVTTGPAIAMTGAPAVLATGSIDPSPSGSRRGRWPLVIGGLVVAAALTGVAVRMKTSTVATVGTATPAVPTTVVATAGMTGTPTSETPPEKAPFVDPNDRGAHAATVTDHGAADPADHAGAHKNVSSNSGRTSLSDTSHAQISRNVGPVPPVAAEPARPPEPAPAPPPAPAPDPPPVAAAPAVPAAPPPPAFNVATAGVDVGGATNTQQIGAARVNATMGRVKGAISQCYLRVLPTMSGSLEGAGTLHLETDDNGTITSATLKGAVTGAVASCIESSVRGKKIDGVDTGSASADVPLVFRAK